MPATPRPGPANMAGPSIKSVIARHCTTVNRMAAKVLAESGMKVVVLEAGPTWYSESDGAMFKWNYESMRRGVATPARHFGEFDGCLGGWSLDGEPYTHAPGTEWRWFRSRMLGGRTHHWGRISLRFGPNDFKVRSIDGEGDDWPIGYDDIKPYYDKVDQLVGMSPIHLGRINHCCHHHPCDATTVAAG